MENDTHYKVLTFDEAWDSCDVRRIHDLAPLVKALLAYSGTTQADFCKKHKLSRDNFNKVFPTSDSYHAIAKKTEMAKATVRAVFKGFELDPFILIKDAPSKQLLADAVNMSNLGFDFFDAAFGKIIRAVLQKPEINEIIQILASAKIEPSNWQIIQAAFDASQSNEETSLIASASHQGVEDTLNKLRGCDQKTILFIGSNIRLIENIKPDNYEMVTSVIQACDIG